MAKKLLLLFLSLVIFISQSFATGIAANDTTASCDNETLGQTSGTANIEVDWVPNTINLRWYNENERLTVQSSAQSCVYDDDLYLPNTQPTKTGYTFKGWEIDRSCGLKSVDTSINAVGRCINEMNGRHRCWLNATYNLTEKSTWSVFFDYGVIFGDALCSSTFLGDGYIGNPDTNNTGNHCWCRITGFSWPEGGLCSTTSRWIYESLNSGNTCTNDCADTCAYRLHVYQQRRKTLYDSIQ